LFHRTLQLTLQPGKLGSAHARNGRLIAHDTMGLKTPPAGPESSRLESGVARLEAGVCAASQDATLEAATWAETSLVAAAECAGYLDAGSLARVVIGANQSAALSAFVRPVGASCITDPAEVYSAVRRILCTRMVGTGVIGTRVLSARIVGAWIVGTTAIRVATIRVATIRVATIRVATIRVATIRVAAICVAAICVAAIRVAAIRVATAVGIRYVDAAVVPASLAGRLAWIKDHGPLGRGDTRSQRHHQIADFKRDHIGLRDPRVSSLTQARLSGLTRFTGSLGRRIRSSPYSSEVHHFLSLLPVFSMIPLLSLS
jgi:hypothetical protein